MDVHEDCVDVQSHNFCVLGKLCLSITELRCFQLIQISCTVHVHVVHVTHM